MRLPLDRALLCLQLLLEGNSVRSAERITGVHRDTILALLEVAGERAETLLTQRIRGLSVRDVQCDEIWGWVGMKEKNKTIDTDLLGDAYCFVAIERTTKLILAWHLGRRTAHDTRLFTEKLREATTARFQITTDGFQPYVTAVENSFGIDVDFAQLVKVYSSPADGEQRYSPGEVVDAIVVPRIGMPDYQRVCTSHVERQNLSIRMGMRRMTRLTNAFSKKWANLRYAYALWFAFYNFCRVHTTLRVTPAMESGLTDHQWSIAELIGAATH
ncbi:MAG: IS1 family transposase [Candidatus Korobacteraceae bacterium]|jgi:IS1 family transposase